MCHNKRVTSTFQRNKIIEDNPSFGATHFSDRKTSKKRYLKEKLPRTNIVWRGAKIMAKKREKRTHKKNEEKIAEGTGARENEGKNRVRNVRKDGRFVRKFDESLRVLGE